jgi:hypothetical protein
MNILDMHLKYKIKNENFFISNEINQLRSNIHSKIFDEYDNIIIKPNISYMQFILHRRNE